MTRILIAEPLPSFLVEQIRAQLPDVEIGVVADRSVETFRSVARDAEVLIFMGRPVDRALLDAAPAAKLVQLMLDGYDSVDLRAAADRDILVANTPGANAVAVAEHTVMLMLAVLKRFSQCDHATRAGRFPHDDMMSLGLGDLEGATVGIIGMGRIGREVARRVEAFGADVLSTAHHGAGLSLDDLLARSTVVSLHVPLVDETRGMIGARQFARMRSDAVIVNTSRAALIDLDALRDALKSARIAGAGLDVLWSDDNPFRDFDNVVVTPHVAGFSRGALSNIVGMTADNVERWLAGRPLEGVVRA